MRISLALILDELELESEACIESGANPKFTSAELYVAGGAHARDCLLVCPLSEAIAAENRAGMFFLCVRDRAKDERESPEVMAGIAVTARGIGLRDLFNRVQRVFVKIAEWVMDMERSTARRGGFQELLELSEPVLRNFITVQDSTFKLLSHTGNIRPTDAVMNRLLEYGYHPEENMELFRRHRRLEQFRTRTEIIVSRDRLTSEHDIVKKTFSAGGAMHFIVVMECNHRPASPAVTELFGMLTDYVRTFIDLEIARTGGDGGAVSLALDLLNKAVAGREEAKTRSARCAYPFEGNFRLCLFAFNDEMNVPTARLMQPLAETCAHGLAFSRDGHVLLLGTNPPDMLRFYERIEKILASVDFRCGLSDPFPCLWDLPAACGQARIALDVSARLKPEIARATDHDPRFSFFSEQFARHIVSAARQAAPEVYGPLFGKNAVEKLQEYDMRHRTNTEAILRKFLECERRATAVASALHMHRNTVLHHIGRIERLLDVSLEDAETRLRLLLAFTANDLNPPDSQYPGE